MKETFRFRIHHDENDTRIKELIELLESEDMADEIKAENGELVCRSFDMNDRVRISNFLKGVRAQYRSDFNNQ